MDAMNKILTKDEAKDYVKKHLRLNNFEDKVKENRLAALNELIRATQATYPFQNIDLLATPANLRRVPTYEDVKESHFSGKGGLCMTMNTFMGDLLKHFGYNVYLASASVVGSNYLDNHAIVIVQDLVEQGDLHMVDVGCGFPTFEAIPLTGPSKTFKHSFLEYTITKLDEVTYARLHIKGDFREELRPDVTVPADNMFYSFTLEPRSDDFFQKTMLGTYTKDNSFFLTGLYVCYYPRGKGITLKDNLLRIFEENTGEMTRKSLTTYEDYLNAMRNDLKVDMNKDELKIVDWLGQYKLGKE